MSIALEIEAKSWLDEDAYNRLLSRFSLQKPYIQTNFYLDSPSRLLKSKGASLRVRQKEDGLELTLKLDQDEGRIEMNAALSEDQFDAIKDGRFPESVPMRALEELGISAEELKILASLSTERIDIEIDDGLISIDKNAYGNTVDYEIECESSSMAKAEALLRSFLSQHGIPYRPNAISKQKRALQESGIGASPKAENR